MNFYQTAPPIWRPLLAELAGRPLLGTPGVRDVDAPCDVYEPIDVPMDGEGHGDCETDGHYLCADGTDVCIHIARHVLWRRRDRCETCGTRLVSVRGRSGECPTCDDWPLVLSPTEAAAAPKST